jgi:large repetitive protein
MLASRRLLAKVNLAYRSSFVALLALMIACGDNHAVDIDAPPGPPCSDGIDNDSDGTIDFPDDLGCDDADDETEDSPAKPQCDDNRDNDGDGKIDFPNDPGCPARQADDEVDPCPNGAGCPQCGDEKDNDGNGKTDFPEDTGCESAYDSIEFTDDPNACGQGMVIKPLPTNGTDMGTLVGTSSNVISPCGGGNGLPAIAYVFHLTTPKVIVASTDDAMTMIDTVLDLRTSMCSTAGAEVTCHDDIVPGTGTTANKKSKITRSLKAGTYYLIVGGKTAVDTGQYALKVEFFPGEGTPCTTVAECGPTLECRIPVGQTTMQCAGPVCFDGLDDDGDGKIDYPLDPGCSSPTDSTETDTCANQSDPACPACSNGVDDDQDSTTDYPNDLTCVAASTLSEHCTQAEAVIVATTPQTTGTTVGKVNDYRPPPGSVNGHACSTTTDSLATAPDVAVQLDVPAMDVLSLTLSPVGFNSAQILFGSTCAGTPIDCYDSPTLMAPTNLTAGRYYLIIDGFSNASGTFTLNVSGKIKSGESCESPLAQSGAITCSTGYQCSGTAGSRTCTKTACNDGMDNNGDGKIDYPADPGCTNANDPVEDTVCPGSSCPACADGVDNDGDSQIDFPADTGCLSASSTNEGCLSSEAVVSITSPTTTGTLVGAVDDHNPNCVATNLADKVFTLDIPTPLQRLVIDTNGSVVDTVLSLMNSTCAEPSIACDDDSGDGNNSLIIRTAVAPGSYGIAVDSDSTTLDTFVLHVRGEIVPGGSCEGALFQAGVLVCPPSYDCNGTVGSRTCSATQCHDGIDNNGDGTIDYPNDPSCTSASDNSEVNVCPGTSCPQCGDGVDNDSDGLTDYPADTRCQSASGTLEGCDSDPTTSILMPLTQGTLVGASNDLQPSCVVTVGPERLYTLTVPQLDSLTIDTEGSVVDTVLSFSTSCESPAIACDDDGGVGVGDSLITRGAVQAGTYTIAVDTNGTAPNTFNLNVQGVISPGQSCESPLVATGILRCGLGFACDGPVAQRTCVVAQCIDGLDNNGDGLTDFPADPGCTSFADSTESTVCPGPSCPACGDGVDNDGDGDTDYPADSTCFAASSLSETCSQSEAIGVLTQRVTNGTTTGAVNDYSPTCGSTSLHTAPDLAYEIDLPAMATLTMKLTGFTPAHSLVDSTCGGVPLGCSSSTTVPLTLANVAAGTYYYIIDGSSTGEGPWTLTIGGTVQPGESCEGALFQDGAFTCTFGHACSGSPGARTCNVSQCNDMVDNDGDGKTDHPSDPGCVTKSDDDESDDCSPTVGPNCPVCANGVDDDNDMTTDFPTDTSCLFAAGNSEACKQSELIGVITEPVTTGTTAGATNDFKPTCSSSTHTAPDLTYRLDLPSMATLSLNLTGFDTAHTLLDSTCGGTAIACSDPALMTRTNVAAGTYYVVIDGWGTASGEWSLATTGTVAPGGSCEGALFQAGAFTCTSGFACSGTPGMRTCTLARCNDMIDNDGDGLTDFPSDPGCASAADNNESDDCSPTIGMSCPACANGVDDDMDMTIDYPADVRCPSPSFFTENFCPIEANIAGQIAAVSTVGTLATAADNFEQSCQLNTGNDVSYGLRLPVPVSTLVIDTIGSVATDTVVSFWTASCSMEIGCDDDGDPAGNRSLLTVTNVPAGDYAIQVDGFSSTNNVAFTLNVKGTVAAGVACTSELFESGVLRCPTGTSCTAGTCQ